MTNAQMLRPPCRKKISVNSTSSAPVTISVTVAAVDSAPLVSFAWLLRSASIAASPAWSICSLLRCGGPSISQLRDGVDALGHLLDQAGQPAMNWLTTNVRMPPSTAMLLSNVSATAPPRGAPRRSSQSTAGSSSAASMVASATGTTISSSFLTTHSTRDDRGQQDQQSPRPGRRLADQRADRLVLDDEPRAACR